MTQTIDTRGAEENRSPEQGDWKIGDVILDLYEVRGILGEGGMGKVYLVWHRNWNMNLAVKSPRGDMLCEEGVKKNFIIEAETWVGLLLHPNVVSCYYISEIAGIPRIFMEYADQGSLKDWIQKDGQPGRLYAGSEEEILKRIFDIGIQSAWGLHHAHQNGLIHQDMKPANVILSGEGIAKVTDFGLTKARFLEASPGEARPGNTILATAGGMTLYYCSPEQALKEKLTRRSDLWSWAVSMLEMFAGDVDWSSGSIAPVVLEMKKQSGSFKVKMPDPVMELLRKCFQTDPDARPHSMEGVVEEMKRIYQELFRGPYPRPNPSAIQPKSDMLNNRALSMIDMGKTRDAEVFFEESLKINPHHPETLYNKGIFEYTRGRKDLGELLIEMNRESLAPVSRPWIKQYLEGLIYLELNEAQNAGQRLAESLRLGGGREIRELLASTTDNLEKSVGPMLDFEGHTAPVLETRFGDSGEIAVSGGMDHSIKLWQAEYGKCLMCLEGHAGRVTSLCLSHDNRFLLSGSYDNTLRLWNLKGGGICLN